MYISVSSGKRRLDPVFWGMGAWFVKCSDEDGQRLYIRYRGKSKLAAYRRAMKIIGIRATGYGMGSILWTDAAFPPHFARLCRAAMMPIEIIEPVDVGIHSSWAAEIGP